jgi:protoporphyrinogen oxidase
LIVPRVSALILGAGPTGLGAARRLLELDATASFLLIDEQGCPGGRAGSHTTPEGFTFDHGGHVLFPHAEYVDFLREIDQAVKEWHLSVPIRGIWCNRQAIPTPVQKNLHRLPFPEMMGCL